MRRRWASGGGILRLAGGLVLFVFLLISINVLEVRKTAYSCRSIASCIGLSGWHSNAYTPQERSRVSHSETILRDGTTRFERRYRDGVQADLLVLVLSRDHTSWSSDFRSSPRSIHDLLDLLVSTGLDLSFVSLALLTDSPDEYRALTSVSERLALARLTVILRSRVRPKYQSKDTTVNNNNNNNDGDGEEEDDIPYQNRHDPRVQLARRAHLATIRNYLMQRSLEDESHIVWLDADVLELSPRIIQTMIQHSDAHRDAGILTAACHQNQMDNYDKNAWRVASPSLMDAVGNSDAEHNDAVARLVAERAMIPAVIHGTLNDQILPLDSVGGTILYVRADLVRRGLAFPQYNVVGTTWARAGWIGVETEGLCYAARGLPGGKCFVLGGSHHVRHTDWG